MKIKRIGIRITMYYSLVILFLILIISISLSYVFSDEIIVQNNKLANNKLNIITYNVDSEIELIKGLHNEITNDFIIKSLINSIQKDIDTLSNLSNESLINDIEQDIDVLSSNLSNQLLKYKQRKPFIVNLFFVDTENRIMDPLYKTEYYNTIINGNAEFLQYKREKYKSKFSNPTAYPFKNNSNKNNIIYYGQFLRTNDYSLLGYIIINYKIQALFSKIEDFCKEAFDVVYIINENNEIIYSIGDQDVVQDVFTLDEERKQDEFIYKSETNKYFIYNRSLSQYPLWKVVGVNKYDTVISNMKKLYLLVIYIGLISIVIIIVISYYIAKRITIPIRDVSKAMKKFESFQWPDLIEPKTEDELKSLVGGFNKMVVNIRRLTDQIQTETEERKKVELASLKFQLDLLQSQINPHFIHNTLNSIQYLALRDGAHEAREMIQSLNLLLRASMSVGVEIVPLEDEIRYLEGYINIQKNRYKERFRVTKRICEDANLFYIPKLILQPLVENALYHGILPKESKERIGEIVIEIKKEQNELVFVISDDGIGMDEDKLQNIYNEMNTKKSGGYNHIGLNNVNERLKLYFGSECRLVINSKTGVGTSVMFKIKLTDKILNGNQA